MRLQTFRRRSASPERLIAPNATAPGPRVVGRTHRRWWIGLAVVVGGLLLLQSAATPIVTRRLNRQLAELEGYRGEAQRVTVALWRGAVIVDGFRLHERGQEREVPVVKLAHVTLRFALSALFRGQLGGAAVVEGLELNLVKQERVSPEEAADKAGDQLEKAKHQAQRWQEALRRSFPVTLRRLEIKQARVRYLDRSHQPNPELTLTDLHVVARDLQNRPKANGDPLPAKLDLDGRFGGGGTLRASVQLDPIAQEPTFHALFEVRELALPPLNAFLRAYAKADVSRGTFEVYMEADARNGGYDGYVKPMFHDLDFRTASDEGKDVVEKLKEKVVRVVTSVLKNPEKEQVATKAPFRGNFSDNRVDVWTTVAELFRNAFVQALRGGFEGQTPRG